MLHTKKNYTNKVVMSTLRQLIAIVKFLLYVFICEI